MMSVLGVCIGSGIEISDLADASSDEQCGRSRNFRRRQYAKIWIAMTFQRPLLSWRSRLNSTPFDIGSS